MRNACELVVDRSEGTLNEPDASIPFGLGFDDLFRFSNEPEMFVLLLKQHATVAFGFNFSTQFGGIHLQHIASVVRCVSRGRNRRDV